MANAPLSTDLLAKIAAAKRSDVRGGNIVDGNYIFEVTRFHISKKRKGVMWFAEMVVVESEPSFPGVSPNPPGALVSVNGNLDTNDAAANNMRDYVSALADLPMNATSDDYMRWLEHYRAEANPARGMSIGDSTFRSTIKTGPNAGKPFVGHNWVHVKQSPAEVAARRAALDAAGK